MSFVKYSLLSFPLASFGLGVWQLKRLEWKKGLIAKLEERIQQEPLDILELKSINDLESLEYRRIKAKGKFDQHPAHQIYLKPRQLFVNNEAILRGRTAHQSNIGSNVITPFIVDGTNLKILVNRGWLASKGTDSVENSSDIKILGDKTIDLVGILRLTDKRPRYGLKNNESTNQWQIRDVNAMAKVLNTAPIFLDADEDLCKGNGPIGGQTQLNVRNEHLNYAITWFSLSIFSFLMWYSKYGRNLRKLLSVLHK